jgi:hypothetical protein
MTIYIDRKYHSALLRDPDHLKYEIYSFMKCVSSFYNLTPYQEECLRIRFTDTWNDRIIHFNKIRYENVILGLLKYCIDYDWCDIELMSIEPFINNVYPMDTRQDNRISIFKVYQTATEIFADNQSLAYTSSVSGSTGITC